MEDITSKQGENHVTSTQFRAILAAVLGSGSYIADQDDQLEPELAANNILNIHSGVLIHHGSVRRVPPGTYDQVAYLNGTQAMKRIDLVVVRYTKSGGIETSEWVVIQGTPAESDPEVPAHTEGNMQNGDLVDDCPVFELHFDGLNVTEVKVLLEVAPNIQGLKEELNSELESTNKPAFTTATTRKNIASGESLSTILGKIAKWFTDLKTGAFNTVANNLTTTDSGYVLDARQGKTLLSKITSGLTRLSSSTGIGKMVLPNGAIVVYGAILSSSMSSDSDTGGYSATVDLSSYGLTAPLFAMATARYPNGHPFATIHSIDDTNKKIKLGCNVSNKTCYIEWLVIG